MITGGRQGEGQPEGEQTVICFKGAKAVVSLSYGLNAVATVAVTLPVRNRQVIPDDHFSGIGVLDLDEQVVLLDLAI